MDKRKILKIKHYSNSTQFTYSPINFNHSNSVRVIRCHSSSDEINRCSVSRSISTIKELCLCNDFDYFFTLTLKDKKRANTSYAVSFINSKIKEYAKLAKKQKKDFKYLYVFEKQKKRGNSYTRVF